MKILIKAIEQNSKNRPEGYYEDVISHGVVQGEFLEIDTNSYNELLNKYRITPNNYSGSIKGLGDLVSIPAQAIAKGLDKVFHSNIAGCGGCKKRQEWLNNKVPF
jgi:hypothetical protein